MIVASLGGARRADARLSRASRATARTRCSTCRCSESRRSRGVSIVAFALSAGMFAMFLYLTLYIQDVLQLLAASRPVCASCRRPCSRSSSPRSPAETLHRIPAGRLMGTGMILVGLGLLPPARDRGRRQLDRPAARIHPHRHRRRHDQPRRRLGRDRRRRAGASRHGVGHQQHLPPGRHRDRHRGARSNLPGADRVKARRTAAATRRRSFADAVSSGAAHTAVQAAPPHFRRRRLHAADTAFVSAFNEILVVGAAIALRRARSPRGC